MDPIVTVSVVNGAALIIVALLGMRIKSAVTGVHKDVNSRLDQWKAESKKEKVEAVIAAYAKGKEDERKKH